MDRQHTTEDDFRIVSDEEGDHLCVNAAGWSPVFEEVMRTSGLSSLRIAPDWAQDDLSFLVNLPFLESLSVIYRGNIVVDLGVITEMPRLQLLGLYGCRPASRVELAGLRLTDLAVDYDKRFADVFELGTLSRLYINRYPREDLKPLSELADLLRLSIVSRKLRSLDGVPVRLREADFYDCRALEDVGSLATCRELQQLEVERCKKVFNLRALSKLEELRLLRLRSCGEIESLAPLKHCRKLEHVDLFQTAPVDGDYSPVSTVAKKFGFRV